MIKISYDELTKQPFQRAVQKLSAMPMNTPEAFRVKHIVKGLQKHLSEMGDKFRLEILAKYAKGGEEAPAGGVEGKSAELNLPFNAIEGVEDEAKDAITKFGKREVTVSFNKIRGDVLLSFGSWTAAELIALEPIVADHVLPAEEIGEQKSS